MSENKETIGFVGVGLMGHGMANSLLEKHYPLTIIGHRNRKPVDDLVAKGASEAGSIPELGAASSIVHICAPGSPQVESIVAELLDGMARGGVIIDCSTSDPVSTAKLAEQAAAKEIAFVDAPLGGTPVQAEAGELSAMVGAEDSVFNRVEPIINSWAKSIVHIGGVGTGHRMKLLNNFLSLGYAALYSEALAIGNKAGISPQTFDSVIRGGRMDCGFYQSFMGHLIDGNRESHKFTLTNAHKDMRYMQSMADGVGAANPIGNAIKNSFAYACANGGDGPQDYIPQLPEFIARLNGTSFDPKA